MRRAMGRSTTSVPIDANTEGIRIHQVAALEADEQARTKTMWRNIVPRKVRRSSQKSLTAARVYASSSHMDCVGKRMAATTSTSSDAPSPIRSIDRPAASVRSSFSSAGHLRPCGRVVIRAE